MRKNHFLKFAIFPIIAFLLISFSHAEQPFEFSSEDRGNVRDSAQSVFHIKVPQDFTQEQVDESGILKWKKDSGEIYAVVGDLFFSSGDLLLKAVRKAAETDNTLQEVKTLRLKGGKAVLCKEKPPDETGRLRSWRLIVVTDKKVINVDFTAPAKDFESFVPVFEEVLKSFKVTSPS